MNQLKDVVEANDQCQHICTDHPCSLQLARNEMPRVASKKEGSSNNETAVMRRRFYDSNVGAKGAKYNVLNNNTMWLPRDSSLKVFTILRDPTERFDPSITISGRPIGALKITETNARLFNSRLWNG